jgi:hypothetical protein
MPAKRYFCINDDTELLAGILSNGSKSSCDKSAQLDGTVKQSEPVTNGITEPSSTSDGSAPVMTKAHNLFSPNVTTCSNEKEEQDLTKLPNCSIYKTKEIKPKLINNISDVRNIRSYLITALYNSRLTLNSYWKSRVNHDMNKR